MCSAFLGVCVFILIQFGKKIQNNLLKSPNNKRLMKINSSNHGLLVNPLICMGSVMNEQPDCYDNLTDIYSTEFNVTCL